MKDFARQLTQKCVSMGLLDESYSEWFAYSIEKRVTTLLTWLVQCLIGGFCFGWTLTISFSVFFLLIRKYTNGYHAATYSKCLFHSILLEVVLLASISYVFHVQHLDDGSSLTSYRKDVATILPSEFPTSISPYADGSINQDSWDSSNTVRAYTTIYYDIVKDSGDRSYYKLTKVTGKYYCNNSATKITSQTLRIGQTGWTSNGYREQTKDFDIPASQKNWTKYPDSSWAGVLVDATNHVGCYYVVNIAAKTGKTWYVEISNNIR